jgi:hypothetical protein
MIYEMVMSGMKGGLSVIVILILWMHYEMDEW